LSTVWGIPLSESYPLMGLLNCPVCKEASQSPEWYPYCARAHYREDHNIGSRGAQSVNLICDECGKTFQRKVSEIVNAARPRYNKPNGGINHVFCDKTCHGKWWGKTHGIGTRPEDKQKGDTALKHRGPATH